MSGPPGLEYENYAPGEWLMRIRPRQPSLASILFIPPLFEEMNRTRALIAAVMRRLARRGHDCILPDLPGTGESERALETCSWDDWRNAVERLPASGLVASIRGGCLIDDAAAASAYWRFAPVAGHSLRRDLDRASLAGGASAAGYAASEALLEALKTATLAPLSRLRTVRLATDASDADAKLNGPALWRRSEPGHSDALADAIAEDIAGWAARCAG